MERRVIVPPYCGTPRLSHQLPFTEVVVVVLDVGGAATVEEVVFVTVGFELVVSVVILVVVVVVQEAKTIDVSKRQVSTVQKIRFFIWPPFYAK